MKKNNGKPFVERRSKPITVDGRKFRVRAYKIRGRKSKGVKIYGANY